MTKQFTWSYSSLTAFETCPLKFYHARIAKDFTESTSLAMAMGTEAHRILEENVKNGTPIPPVYSVTIDGKTEQCSTANWTFVDELATRAGTRYPEMQIALTKDLKQTDWFAKDVWVRGIIDLAIRHDTNPTLMIVDYKTGKRRPDSDQLKLFAGMAFTLWPDIEKVVTAFLWCKTGEIDSDSFTREQYRAIWEGFDYRVNRMATAYETDRWDANPSGLCKKWCPVKTCKFNGDYTK